LLTFTEITPVDSLQPWVQCFWTISAPRALPEPVSTRVVPSGRLDLILNLGSPLLTPRITNGSQAKAQPIVLAPLQSAFILSFAEKADLIGVRFNYGGASPFLGLSGDSCQRHVADESKSLVNAATLSRLRRIADPLERCRLLEARLLQRLATCHTPPDGELSDMVGMVESVFGSLRVRDLRRSMGCSERQLERWFKRMLGMSPTAFLRLYRLRAVLHLLRNDSTMTWTEIAHTCGFYDQAHFINAFRNLTGVAPTTYTSEDADRGIINFYLRRELYHRYPSLTSPRG
jgi:AraC-like DNA-binding protein